MTDKKISRLQQRVINFLTGNGWEENGVDAARRSGGLRRRDSVAVRLAERETIRGQWNAIQDRRPVGDPVRGRLVRRGHRAVGGGDGDRAVGADGVAARGAGDSARGEPSGASDVRSSRRGARGGLRRVAGGRGRDCPGRRAAEVPRGAGLDGGDLRPDGGRGPPGAWRRTRDGGGTRGGVLVRVRVHARGQRRGAGVLSGAGVRGDAAAGVLPG